MTDRSKTVVMLIDWDNLQICHSRDAPGTELDLQALIALAQSYGTLVSARAYAEWNLLAERLAVYKAGIEPVFAPVMRPEGSPREGKSLADTVMVADGVDLLWTVAPDVFVLATSDKDMIPLARIAKQRGAAVVVLGSDLTAIPLVEMSNVFITYRQLLRELDRVSELEAPVGRAPARERRLRESRRPSSEPYGGGGFGSGSGFGGGPIGAGGRSGPRPVGPVGAIGAPPAPAVPLPAPTAPRRRFQEPMVMPAAPTEVERPLAVQPIPAPPAPEVETPAEPLDIGAGDVAPRRRRRRGGRGRRSGLGGLGDGDVLIETLPDASDEPADADDAREAQGQVSASGASPDDIDSAVLQLLAARDREQDAALEAEIVSPLVAEVPSAPVAPAPSSPTPPRRAVRTSFSAFGPPEISFRPVTPAAVVSTPDTSAPDALGEPAGDATSAEGVVTSADVSANAPIEAPDEASVGASIVGSVVEGRSSDIGAAGPIRRVPEAAAPSGDDPSTVFGTVSTGSDEADDAAGTAPTSGARARSGRSGRSGAGRSGGTGTGRSGSGRRTRTGGASGSGADAAASAPTSAPALAPAAAAANSASPTSDTTSGADGEVARAPRRRRTRRPTSTGSEGSTPEPIAASEASV